ncbi:MAG: hypothetical protein J7K36_09450 [Archaeoglobaceae archaeon]|nr:hypothetical protein [Archaeoglobaceae archaeon]
MLDKNYDDLLNLDLKKVATILISFLYGDELLMFRASEALGIVCGRLDEKDTEYVRNVLRKLFWHLNDESGAYCKGAPLAIGEIGRNAKRAFENFKNMTVSLLDNGEVEKKYVIYAIGRAAENIKDAYPNPIEKLKPLLNEEDEIRGYAVWALKKLGIDLFDEVKDGEIVFYNGDLTKVRIKDLRKI